VLVPNALRESQAFTERLIALAASEHASVVLPIGEPSILALLAERNKLLPAVIPFPELDAFSALTDKRLLLDEAAKLGIRVPDQVVLNDRAAVETLDVESLRFPIVLKPARSVGEFAGTRSKLGVSYADGPPDLRRRIGLLPAAAFPVLLQQRVVGPGIGIFLLVWNGQVRAEFAHRRLTEKPVTGGVSVYRESVAMDDELKELSRKLLERFQWNGVAMIEYKIDEATGTPYLMEVNGRFWGSLQLAIDAGVDFPHILVDCIHGDMNPPALDYRVGVRSRWWWGQVDHLVARIRGGSQAQQLSGIPTATRALGDLLLGPFRTGDYEEVLRWNDPGPFCYETIRWLARQ
jgi:predicted ATP-grasp superfamily ATP-dependent carboligase